MADLKISQLSDGGASQATDEYVVARSGANYRIDGASVAAAATSVGTLSSLTVSGDLTVDTSTLKVDSANNRVGINTTSPSSSLNVVGSNSARVTIDDTSNNAAGAGVYFRVYNGASLVGNSTIRVTNAGALGFFTGTSSDALNMTLDASGNLAVDTNTLYVDATNNRVGIGTASPTSILSIATGSGVAALAEFAGNGNTLGTTSLAVGQDSDGTAYVYQRANKSLIFGTNNTARVYLDSSGNLGLGVTPSAWASGFRAVQVGNGAAFWGLNDVRYAYMSANVYYDGATKYLGTGAATWYIQELGAHKWQTAASGTAGNAITFTQAMTLDASGNLGVGLTSPGRRLSVSATVPYIQLCNSTTGTSAGDGFELAVANSDAYIIQRENAPMLFYTNDTERARITAGGDFCVNATSGNGKITVEVPDGTTNAFYAARTGGSPATLDLDFANAYVNWNASVRYQIVSGGSGGVYLDSTATSWTAVSDERFKTDLTPIADAVTKVNTLRAVTGRYITDDEAKSRAFLIAQDVQAVLPEAVSDSDPDCLGLSYTDVVPLLVAAIKELTARLEALEA